MYIFFKEMVWNLFLNIFISKIRITNYIQFSINYSEINIIEALIPPSKARRQIMIGFAFNGCDTFGDAALFLIIYRILHELHISGKRFKKGANVVPSFCNFMKMQQKVVYGWTTIKFNMSPWYNHGRIPLFIEWYWRSFKSKTLQVASSNNILSTHTVR